MKHKLTHWIQSHLRVYGLLALVLTACASAPVQEMSNARQAVQAALQSGAASAAPTQMNAAQSALKLAERLMRDHQYTAARDYARQARTKAVEAQQIVQGQHSASPTTPALNDSK